MEKKKKKLLLVVGVLLVLTLGTTFAYFVSSSLTSGSGNKLSTTTASIKGSELTVTGILELNDINILPGHKNISSVKVTATGDNELIAYNLIWSGTNTLNTPLNFTVYKTSAEIETSTTCEQVKKVVDGSIYYNENCTITNLEKLGSMVSTGTINNSETKVTLAEDQFITSSVDGTNTYYYIILEYPNLDENQNSDIGGTFSGKVTVEQSDVEPDINILAAYIEQDDGTYQEVSDIPTSGYVVNIEKSTCSNGATASGTVPNITINNLSKSGTSCYLYFDKGLFAKDTILANNIIDESRSSVSFTDVFTDNTAGAIFSGTDDYGTTYFFAGANPNNWVNFAGFYWRIIRVNGDGSIRLIYNGTTTDQTGETTQIGTSAFNSSYDDNAYVGYMYGTAGSDNYDDTHANINDSTIKGVLERWYKSNLFYRYASYIDTNAGFCGDRSVNTGSEIWDSKDTRLGYGNNLTWYGASYRTYMSVTPSFKCSQTNDLYTVSSSSYGNKALTYPIGLITADEVTYAGCYKSYSNSSYWLYTNSTYWSMTPYASTNVLVVYAGGAIGANGNNLKTEYGVRPVINLKADTTFSGAGQSDDPYIVSSD